MNTSLIKNGQYNIGYICSTLQCETGRKDRPAMRWIGAHDERAEYSFGDLDRESARFANVLQSLGFQAGDVFFIFMPKAPELFFAFLGALKLRLITGTLFPNFGAEALLDRLGDSGAKGVLIRKSSLKKLLPIRHRLPKLQTIIVVDDTEEQPGGICSYAKRIAAASDQFETPRTPANTPSVLHYTSGSTGKPKGALHQHGSVLTQSQTTTEVLGLTEGDLFWCTADQGWVTGISYGIIGPWSLGITQLHFGGAYQAEKWFQIIEEAGVTVWYTAPTALRMLMREDPGVFARFNLAKLRHIFSVGEPLNPEVIHWARRILGHDIYDTWFQTETGAIMISNRPGLPIRPGSMGQPVTGIEAAIIADNGQLVPRGGQGNLGLNPGFPSMFINYYQHEDIYKGKFRNSWYMTGDTACQDAEGYFWFKGRSDDVINTAGHLVSPFEVESALLEVPAVAESGVIAAPDEILFEKVVAFVALRPGVEWSEDLELSIRLHISNRVSTMATPQDFRVVSSIPKNKSGKIMRRVLKARYLGLPEGDTSTLDI